MTSVWLAVPFDGFPFAGDSASSNVAAETMALNDLAEARMACNGGPSRANQPVKDGPTGTGWYFPPLEL